MGRFERRDDAFLRTAQLERLQRFGIGDGNIFRPADFVQPRVFRPNPRIVQPGRDREPFEDLPVIILQQVGAVAVQHAGAPPGQRGAMLHLVVHALAARFDADDVHVLVVEKREEEAHSVGPAADGRDDRIGQTAFGLRHLFADLLADDGLKIAHHGRIGMRASDGSDAIEGIAHIGDPVAQRVVHGVLQGAPPAGHGNDLGPQQAHAEDVGRLPLDVMGAHVDHALQPELGTDRRRGHPVLTGPGFGDDAFLAHPPGEDDLPQHVVDLVRARVVQLVALHVDLGTAKMVRQPLAEIKRAGAAHVMGPEIVHFGPEAVVGLGPLVLFFQFEDQRHERFGHEAPAEIAETAIFIRAGHEAVEKIVCHGASPARYPPPLAQRRGPCHRHFQVAMSRHSKSFRSPRFNSPSSLSLTASSTDCPSCGARPSSSVSFSSSFCFTFCSARAFSSPKLRSTAAFTSALMEGSAHGPVICTGMARPRSPFRRRAFGVSV